MTSAQVRPAMAVLVCLVLCAMFGTAFAQVTLTGTFTRGEQTGLQLRATGLVLTGSDAFVVGERDGEGHVLLIDVAEMTIAAERPLPFLPESIAVSDDGNAIYVMGGAGPNGEQGTELLVFDPDLTPISRLSEPIPLIGATISHDGASILVLVGRPVSLGQQSAFVIDTSQAANPVVMGTLTLPAYSAAVSSIWLSKSLNVAFANMATETALVAIEHSKGAPISDLRFVTKAARTASAFTVLALLPDMPCRAGEAASFVIADPARDQLLLAAYDPKFQSLDVLTQVLLASTAPVYGGGPDQILLASACDQSVIWLGRSGLTEVTQFAAPMHRNTLEKVGTVQLPGPASLLAVSPAGDMAMAILSDGTAVRFDLPAASPGSVIIGRDDIRQIQRLLSSKGYSVGAIDGLMGENTRRAAGAFTAQTGVAIDLNGDLDQAIIKLEEVKK